MVNTIMKPGQELPDGTILIESREGMWLSMKTHDDIQRFVFRRGEEGNGIYFAEIWSAANFFNQCLTVALEIK